MERRDFLKIASCAGLAVAAPSAFAGSQLEGNRPKNLGPYKGKLFVSVHAGGGWDPTSLCDPKGASGNSATQILNAMNRSFLTSEIANAGNIRYAPLPDSSLFTGQLANYPITMEQFFSRHYQKMTVINGIDAETNGHDSGTRNIWSGRLSEGFPSFAAYVAGAMGSSQPMAYLSFAGYAETAGIVARTRAGNTNVLNRLAYPTRMDANNAASGFHADAVQALIDQSQAKRDQALATAQGLPKIKAAINTLYTARSGSNELKKLQEFLPDTLEQGMRGQAQLIIAAYRAGICVSAGLGGGGFDTHGNHDAQQIPALLNVLDGVDFLMEEAERHGVADQLVVAMGSDFGRTPYYNDGNGKDHWSVTSMIFMGAGIPGNRVIGATDEEHNAYGVTDTLEVDKSAGARRIHPSDIHYALRKLAGLADGELARTFPLELKGNPLPLFG